MPVMRGMKGPAVVEGPAWTIERMLIEGRWVWEENRRRDDEAGL